MNDPRYLMRDFDSMSNDNMSNEDWLESWEGLTIQSITSSVDTASIAQDNSVSEYTDTGWASEYKEVTIADELDDAGLTDKAIAQELTHIALNADKAKNVWEWEIINVPDYTNRRETLKLALKLKGHLNERTDSQMKAKKHITYILAQPTKNPTQL